MVTATDDDQGEALNGVARPLPKRSTKLICVEVDEQRGRKLTTHPIHWRQITRKVSQKGLYRRNETSLSPLLQQYQRQDPPPLSPSNWRQRPWMPPCLNKNPQLLNPKIDHQTHQTMLLTRKRGKGDVNRTHGFGSMQRSTRKHCLGTYLTPTP